MCKVIYDSYLKNLDAVQCCAIEMQRIQKKQYVNEVNLSQDYIP